MSAVIVLSLVVIVGIPLLVALVELMLLVLRGAAGVVGRVLFRRPWIVDSVSPEGGHHVGRVVGWRASGRVSRFIAERLAATGEPPSPAEVEVASRLA